MHPPELMTPNAQVTTRYKLPDRKTGVVDEKAPLLVMSNSFDYTRSYGVTEIATGISGLLKRGSDFTKAFPRLKKIAIVLHPDVQCVNGVVLPLFTDPDNPPWDSISYCKNRTLDQMPELPKSCTEMKIMMCCKDVPMTPTFIPAQIERLEITGIRNCRFMKHFGKSIFPTGLKHLILRIDENSSNFKLHFEPGFGPGTLEMLTVLYPDRTHKLQIEAVPAKLLSLISFHVETPESELKTEFILNNMPKCLTKLILDPRGCPKLSIKSSFLETIYLNNLVSGISSLGRKEHPKLQQLYMLGYWVFYEKRQIDWFLFSGISELYIEHCVVKNDDKLYKKFPNLKLIGLGEGRNYKPIDKRTRIYFLS